MATLAFDTHAAVKRLQDAGADERLAEAFVSTFGEVVSGNAITKADLATTRADLKTDIATLAVRLDNLSESAATKTDIATLELRMAHRLYAAAGISVGLVVGLVKLLDWIIG